LKGTFFLISALLIASSAPRAQATNPFLGQWNISGQGTDSAIVYWLELKEENGKLTSLFLNRTSHPVPLTAVKIEGDELIFQAGGTAEKPTGPEFHAKVEGGKLVGHHTVTVRGRAGATGAPAPAPAERTINWIGVRPPVWPASNANGKHTYGKPVVLYDSSAPPTSLDDVWGSQGNRPVNWTIDADHLLANPVPGGVNLVSKQKFDNFKVLVEYKLEPKSNSGIYLRGRYELQVLDDLTDTTTEKFLTQAAIYGRRAPDVLASKAPGEWQTMEAVMVGNKVTVTLNGKRVHDNQPVIGVTGGTLDNDELSPGPLMIQGDHGHIWIRKIIVTPITKAGK
jgi:hypothetical protein